MGYTKSTTFRVDHSRSYYQDSSQGSSPQTFSQTDTKSGSRVERWRDKISKALPAGSAYSRTAWRYDSTASGCDVSGYFTANSSVKRKVGSNGVLLPLQVPSSLGVSSPENKALSRFYSSLKDKQAGMNGMLILGELRETIKMLRRPGEGLLTLFNDYLGTAKGLRQTYASRKGGGNRRRFQKAISDLWLETAFGWRPLISDVKDIATTVARIVHDNALRTERASGTAADSKAQVDPPFYDSDYITVTPGVVFLHARSRKSEIGVRYVGAISASTYGPTGLFEQLARETGFTLDNFVPTVWNLIPYSFLVDYFVNIGDCLEASFADTAGLAWWSKSVRAIDSVHLTSTFDKAKTIEGWTNAGYTAQSASGHGGQVFAVRTSLTRTVGDASTLPLPGLTVSLPGLDSSKWWNMLALFGGKAAGAHLP